MANCGHKCNDNFKLYGHKCNENFKHHHTFKLVTLEGHHLLKVTFIIYYWFYMHTLITYTIYKLCYFMDLRWNFVHAHYTFTLYIYNTLIAK